MSALKYDPSEPADEAMLVIRGPADGEDGFVVAFSGEDWAVSEEDAERLRQEYAIAIADRVHGDELARLRAKCQALADTTRDTLETLGRATSAESCLEKLRTAMIAWAADVGGDSIYEDARYAFNRASDRLGLPKCDRLGMPAELRRPSPCKPTMLPAERTGGWHVLWGPGPLDGAVIDELEDALEEFGRRYVAWDAGGAK